VGDSFCSAAHGWPQHLADLLGMQLDCYGQGGTAWWTVRDHLQKHHVSPDNVVVFVHTNADRIPTLDYDLVSFDHSAEPTNELETAVKLYYKYIHNPEFMAWAQQAWFKEIAQAYAVNRVVHLHSFPWSVNLPESGVNVVTPLAALSLNELGKTDFDLFNDSRANHFSAANNQALATELAHLINNYCPGRAVLDHTRFEQRILKWFDWK
jgi:hypothetical protein